MPTFFSTTPENHLGIVRDLFDREVCIRVSTNVLRHSIVTYFKTLEDSEDLKIRESLARLIVSSSYRKNLFQDASLINVRWFS